MSPPFLFLLTPLIVVTVQAWLCVRPGICLEGGGRSGVLCTINAGLPELWSTAAPLLDQAYADENGFWKIQYQTLSSMERRPDLFLRFYVLDPVAGVWHLKCSTYLYRKWPVWQVLENKMDLAYDCS